MNTKTGFQVLSLAAALMGASVAMPASGALAQDAVAQSDTQQQAGTTGRAARADLEGSVIRIVTSNEAARASTVSLRTIVLPRILGTYR